MLSKYAKKKGRLTLFVMLLGLTLIAVILMAMPHCVCLPCMFINPNTMKPLDQGNHCHCTSYASQMFESAFGHKERPSETMSKSTRPCDAKVARIENKR